VVLSKSAGGGMLRTSHDIHDVAELNDCLVVMADGRAEDVRKTREATADDVLAMIILGESESVPGPIVSSSR
jgi:ABC-type sugar transport system ATPase subunit